MSVETQRLPPKTMKEDILRDEPEHSVYSSSAASSSAAATRQHRRSPRQAVNSRKSVPKASSTSSSGSKPRRHAQHNFNNNSSNNNSKHKPSSHHPGAPSSSMAAPTAETDDDDEDVPPPLESVRRVVSASSYIPSASAPGLNRATSGDMAKTKQALLRKQQHEHPKTAETVPKPKLMHKLKAEQNLKLFNCAFLPSNLTDSVDTASNGKEEGDASASETSLASDIEETEVLDEASEIDESVIEIHRRVVIDGFLKDSITDADGFPTSTDDDGFPTFGVEENRGRKNDAKLNAFIDDNFYPSSKEEEHFHERSTFGLDNVCIDGSHPTTQSSDIDKHKNSGNEAMKAAASDEECSSADESEGIISDSDHEEEQEPENKELDLFGSPNWGFTLQSDNAGGHFDEEENENAQDETISNDDVRHSDKSEAQSEGEEEEERTREEKLEEEREGEQEWEAKELFEPDYDREDDDDSESDDDDANQQHESSVSAQALLQFNYDTPDGLDFAVCDKEDGASIFRMESNKTLQVPEYTTTELTDFNKQLLYVTGKEKKNAMSKLIKAKSFKRPKASGLMSAAMTKAESFRMPSGKKRLKETKGRRGSLDSNALGGKQSEKLESYDESGRRELHDNNARKEKKVEKDSNDNKQDREIAANKSTDSNNDMDKSAISTSRKRRERVKSRRESTRDKLNDKNDEERRERLRKRDALRKAASARNLPTRSLSENSPKTKRTSCVGHGRRRGCTTDERLNNIPNIEDSDQVGRQGEKHNSTHDDKAVVSSIRKRSTVRRSHSARNVGASRTSSSTKSGNKNAFRRCTTESEATTSASKKPLRRCNTGDASASATRRLASSTRVRHSDGRHHRRSRATRDRDGESDLDKSRKSDIDKSRKSDIDKSRKSDIDKSRKSDVDRSRRSDIDRSRRSDIDRSRRSDIDRSRRSVVDRSRKSDVDRSRKSDIDRSRMGEMGNESAEDNHERRHVERKHSRRKPRRREGEGANHDSTRDKYGSDRRQGRRSRRNKDAPGTRGGSRDRRRNNSEAGAKLIDDGSRKGSVQRTKSFDSGVRKIPKSDEWDSPNEPRRRIKSSSSMRTERSALEDSFPDLSSGFTESLSETVHIGPSIDVSDRRKGFMKSLSVKIGAKQNNIGRGARNLIVGGTRVEKTRLLASEDDSVAS